MRVGGSWGCLVCQWLGAILFKFFRCQAFMLGNKKQTRESSRCKVPQEFKLKSSSSKGFARF
jgi:hypothetical protein